MCLEGFLGGYELFSRTLGVTLHHPREILLIGGRDESLIVMIIILIIIIIIAINGIDVENRLY